MAFATRLRVERDDEVKSYELSELAFVLPNEIDQLSVSVRRELKKELARLPEWVRTKDGWVNTSDEDSREELNVHVKVMKKRVEAAAKAAAKAEAEAQKAADKAAKDAAKAAESNDGGKAEENSEGKE